MIKWSTECPSALNEEARCTAWLSCETGCALLDLWPEYTKRSDPETNDYPE